MKFSNPENYIVDFTKSYNQKYETNDCVVIAMSILFGISYDEAHGFSRGFFNRSEREGAYSFEKSMDKMIRNPNLRYNGHVKKIQMRTSMSAKKVTQEFCYGVYLAVTIDHVSVLHNGIWIDYEGIMKPRTEVTSIYQFGDFEHYNNFKPEHNKKASFIDSIFWIIAGLILGIFLISLTDDGKRDLENGKRWLKREVRKRF
jgi:hypothetical protein